jgi:hypothetical protein
MKRKTNAMCLTAVGLKAPEFALSDHSKNAQNPGH